MEVPGPSRGTKTRFSPITAFANASAIPAATLLAVALSMSSIVRTPCNKDFSFVVCYESQVTYIRAVAVNIRASPCACVNAIVGSSLARGSSRLETILCLGIRPYFDLSLVGGWSSGNSCQKREEDNGKLHFG